MIADGIYMKGYQIALKAKMFEITYEFYLIIIYLSMNF